MLACDFAFCIYQKDGLCFCSSISIDGTGMCDSAVTIDLTEEELLRRKMELVDELNRYPPPT